MTQAALPPFSLLILAGGRATRMHGADKGLVLWQGRPLIAHVLDRVIAQDIVISCNRSFAEYERYGRVIADVSDDFAGPLAGMAAGLPLCNHDWVLIVACDMPCLPADLALKLWQALDDGQRIAVAHDGEHLQPLCLLLHRSLAEDIAETVANGQAAAHCWIKRHPHAVAMFDDQDAFRNINTLDELE